MSLAACVRESRATCWCYRSPAEGQGKKRSVLSAFVLEIEKHRWDRDKETDVGWEELSES